MIGKIRRVPLRDVWRHEALDFTSWLEGNVDVLNDVIDLELSGVEREKDAGDFSVDLVAEDSQGNTVIIENQLEKSNHEHLGKILTYLTALDAKAAIWIVKEARPEHVRAITWLNESGLAAFYIVKMEAIQIGNSEPAPLLTLIVGPSEEGREVGATKKEMSERYSTRQLFWVQLLDRAKGRTRLHANATPGEHSSLAAGSGMGGLHYLYTITQDGVGAELYIDRGKDCEDENLAIFSAIKARSAEIEKAFGGPLEWHRLEAKRACRIRWRSDVGGYSAPQVKWTEIHDQMIDAMMRLERAFAPEIAKLKRNEG